MGCRMLRILDPMLLTPARVAGEEEDPERICGIEVIVRGLESPQLYRIFGEITETPGFIQAPNYESLSLQAA